MKEKISNPDLTEEKIDVLFDNHPQPMWIYDPATLKFLTVNKAAVRTYGYSYDEFINMSLKDLRPFNNQSKEEEEVQIVLEKSLNPQSWKHKMKDGKIKDVVLHSKEIYYEGNRARIVEVNDITEQIKIFNELKKSEKKYREFFDKVAVGLAEIDVNRDILKINKKLSEIVGYSESELIGKKFTDITHPDDLEIGPFYFKKSVNNEAVHFNYEKRYITKNGKTIWVKLTTAWLTDLDDDNPRFLSVIQDITKSRNSELYKNLLAAIVESSNNAIIGMDLNLKITSWNKSAERIFGYKKNEVLGKKNTFFHLPNQKDDDVINTRKLLEGENVKNYHTQRLHKDGHPVDVSIIISRIVDNNNCVIGFSKIIQDITWETKASEKIKNLLVKEKDARILAESNQKRLKKINEAGVILNSSLNYKKTLTDLAKLIVPELSDWCTVEILDDNFRLQQVAVEHRDPEKIKLAHKIAEKHRTKLDKKRGAYKVIKSGETEVYSNISDEYIKSIASDEEHFDLLRKLGTKSSIITPLISRDKTFGVISFICSNPLNKSSLLNKELAESLARRAAIAIDNANLYEETQLSNMQLEERVKKRTAQLEVANKELETFSYSVSHDLRAPLRAINSYAGFMLEDYNEVLDEEGKRFLSVVRKSANQMGQLIDDLLSFSRMSRTSMHSASINMKSLVESIFNDLNSLEKDRNIKLIISDLPDCEGDIALIKQVWLNLISNSIKYTKGREDALIEIGGNSNNDEFIYFIKDNGVGFDMKYVDKLFGVFQRLHSSSEFEGTGVGLALVQRIVYRHGGVVKGEGKVNEGAKFCFTIPKMEISL